MASEPAGKKPVPRKTNPKPAAKKKAAGAATPKVPRKVPRLSALTDKQRRFVEEYLVDLNATQAAIRAGYSAETAEQIGYQLLQKTSVVEAISKARQDQQERTAITADTVLMEIANVALADARELVELLVEDGAASTNAPEPGNDPVPNSH